MRREEERLGRRVIVMDTQWRRKGRLKQSRIGSTKGDLTEKGLSGETGLL